jgi:hypothetical protein
MAINLTSPTTFTSGLLIGDTVATSGGSNDTLPTYTTSGGVPVSAALELQSTEGAFLMPRMTTTQRDALTTVVNGMQVYNSTTDQLNIRAGGSWAALPTTASTTLFTSVALDTAAVTGMFAAPETILAAPGAGYSYVVHRAVLQLNVGFIQFANGGDVNLCYGTTQTDLASATIAAAFVNGAADAVIAVDGDINTTTGLALSVTENAALSLTNATGAFDTGNGDLVVYVWYSIVNT